MAERYARAARGVQVYLTRERQYVIQGAPEKACAAQGYRLHAFACDPSHIHVLVSWRIERGWLVVRTGLRQSITRELNVRFGRRAWFSRGGSRHRVREREHFDHLVTSYLPRHRGLTWSERQRSS